MIKEKYEIARQIVKRLEEISKEEYGYVNHSYVLGYLESIFENVFSRISDEDVEHFENVFELNKN